MWALLVLADPAQCPTLERQTRDLITVAFNFVSVRFVAAMARPLGASLVLGVCDTAAVGG